MERRGATNQNNSSPESIEGVKALRQLALPAVQVINEQGQEVGPLDPRMLQQIIQLAQLGQLVKIRRSLEKQEFEGRVDPRTLAATDRVQALSLLANWPFRPWITASAHNYGPNTAYLSINLEYDWIPLQINENHLFDFKSSEDRIYLIYYKCDPGENARVQINGKF